jgi:hypothetical protein
VITLPVPTLKEIRCKKWNEVENLVSLTAEVEALRSFEGSGTKISASRPRRSDSTKTTAAAAPPPPPPPTTTTIKTRL